MENYIDFTEVELCKIITHHVGNKLRDEKYFLSQEESLIENETKNYLLKYFLSSVRNEELYKFSHTVDIDLNNIYSVVQDIFSDSESFILNSQNIAKLLYESSMHPKIKDGQLNVVLFANAIIDKNKTNAIGIFKSESNAPFLQMEKNNSKFSISHQFGFDLKELDKGCIIFNTDDKGYKVAVIDRSKSAEAQYWKDDFLSIEVIKNEYHQTNQFLGIAKQFVTNQLSNEFGITKTDQVDFLNKSVDYFKKHEIFDRTDFEKEVFSDKNVIDAFHNFNQNYSDENEIELPDSFEISEKAVKKQARNFKNIVKLDKNFHIYIHGNRDLIEQGIDENGRKFYKIFYENEI
ncbi:nucleoid-associated protein [Chryseobacterium nematophagum]|uniref:Nucleoid-associated protein n=1 Tax=Chryseobacterium nematophagum TaxID=2305228 RepID=A0A3M7LBW9_9FLAO|nr:nucleoid-associated protein [Chryseobacterium nematophagum]RMZ59709.1 nucleoid-associated protein [Chryseobacterium nematophagum]